MKLLNQVSTANIVQQYHKDYITLTGRPHHYEGCRSASTKRGTRPSTIAMMTGLCHIEASIILRCCFSNKMSERLFLSDQLTVSEHLICRTWDKILTESIIHCRIHIDAPPGFDMLMTSSIIMTSQWARLRLISPASRLFTQSFVQTQIKENIKAPRHWPLRGKFTETNGQLRGKCFHLMTSSWYQTVILIHEKNFICIIRQHRWHFTLI